MRYANRTTTWSRAGRPLPHCLELRGREESVRTFRSCNIEMHGRTSTLLPWVATVYARLSAESSRLICPFDYLIHQTFPRLSIEPITALPSSAAAGASVSCLKVSRTPVRQ